MDAIKLQLKSAAPREHDPRIKADRLEYLANLPRAKTAVRERMRKYFHAQQLEVVANLERAGLPKAAPAGYKTNFGKWLQQVLFDDVKQNGIIKGISADISRSNVAAGAAAIAKLLGIDPSEILASPHVVSFVDRRSFVMLDVNTTTRQALRATLQEGVAVGEDLGQLRNRITGVYDEAQGFRAEMIARTEVGSAQQFGRMEEMKAQKVENQVWVAIFNNTRPAHADADGEVVKVGERFNVGGEFLDYPGDFSGSPDNTINCQCSVSPTLESAD
jgi:hypothetical protein